MTFITTNIGKSALALSFGSFVLAAASHALAQTEAAPKPAARMLHSSTATLGVSAVEPAEKAAAVTVQSAWARAMLPGAKVGAGYFEIRNNSRTAIRLTEVHSNVAQKVEIHSMTMEGNVMKMRHLADGVEIAAQSQISFKPGSYHLMFINPKTPFKAGEKFEAQFKFSNGEIMEVPFTVRAAAGTAEHRP
ncbi:MAG: copper chaperone PCu(A)C [Candidatus Tokpelaia sp.]|nr:MAG: copper chaperone PCu(A)C [Candidatus Tokpelaia sp.]KAA6205393.1 MAG: copper chaperone PCu(A)C [Candidatus Tokpelaia sp.]